MWLNACQVSFYSPADISSAGPIFYAFTTKVPFFRSNSKKQGRS